MAGSYSHLTEEDGSFRFDLIDNMGDAHEACEMCHWMIDYLARHNKDAIKNASFEYFVALRVAQGEPEDDARADLLKIRRGEIK